MSDTPRTDANLGKHLTSTGFPVVDPNFARQLERELTEARTRIKELADIGEDLAGHVEHYAHQQCRRSLKDWEETVKRCLEGIE